MEQWAATSAIATAIGVGVAIVGSLFGVFGWLAKQFAKINDHLGNQDQTIARIETDVAWLKREIDGKQDKQEGK